MTERTTVKTCTKCGEEKPLDEYHKDKRLRCGRRSRCKDCYSAQKAEYRAENRDRIREQKAHYYAENRDVVLAQATEYNAKNPHVHWKSNMVKRAKKYGYEIIVVDFTKADVIEKYGDQCWHCGGPFEQLDHHPTPVSRGGHHVLENVKPSCMPCNKQSWREGDQCPNFTCA